MGFDTGLEAIEGQYGSVAEYNRCREETQREQYWNSLSESEQEWCVIEDSMYRRRADEIEKALSVDSSELAKIAGEKYKTATNDMFWTDSRFTEAKNEAMASIAAQYDSSFMKGAAPNLEKGQGYLSYECYELGMVRHYFSSPLDKDAMVQMFADTREIGGTSIHYRDETNRDPSAVINSSIHIFSNISPSQLRMELARIGKDTEAKTIISNICKKYDTLIADAREKHFEENPIPVEDEEYDKALDAQIRAGESKLTEGPKLKKQIERDDD